MSNTSISSSQVPPVQRGPLSSGQQLPPPLAATASKTSNLSPVKNRKESTISSTISKQKILQVLQNTGIKTLNVFKKLTGIKRAQDYFANNGATNEETFRDAFSTKGREEKR